MGTISTYHNLCGRRTLNQMCACDFCRRPFADDPGKELQATIDRVNERIKAIFDKVRSTHKERDGNGG